MSGKPGNFIASFSRKLRKLFAIPAGALLTWLSKVQPNKIIFMTFNHTYSCNPKYITRELLRQKLPVDIVWVVKSDKPMEVPEGVRTVVYGTYAYLKEVATAKIWVDNAFGFSWNPIPIKKKNQFYIQTWHGSLGLKRIGKENVKDKRWSFAAGLNRKWVDLCVSNSTFETGVFRQTHWPKNEILELGHPRNDILFGKNAEVAARVRAHFGIEGGKKIALYAPTFRNGDAADCYDLDHSRLLVALEERFSGEFVLLNRYHMKTLRARETQTTDPRIIRATDYPDIQELMVASDVGITDYSSWICDFVLTGRPGFLYAPDLETYDRERGFYYPLEETPFPIAQNNDQLIENISGFNAERYAAKKESFLQARGCKENGTAAMRTVEIIKQQCGLI